jgi:hypothetical protein
MIFQSVGNCSPNIIVSHPRRPEFSTIPLREPKTSQTDTKHDTVSTRHVCMYKCNTETHLHNYCCRAQARGITNSECVSIALVIQYAKCVCRIILSSVTCLAVPHFSISSHKRYDFRKQKLSNIMFMLILAATFV